MALLLLVHALALSVAVDGAVIAARNPAPTTSPSGNYAPVRVACPAGLQVRQVPTRCAGHVRPRSSCSGQLGSAEAAYIAQRKATAASAWRDYLQRVGLNTSVDPTDATTALAVSGGGLRAMLYGAPPLARSR